VWELRAREALEELETVRREMVEGKEREELLERENLAMGARLATLTGAEMERSEYAGSPTLRHDSTTPLPSGLPLPVERTTPTPRRHPRGSEDSAASSSSLYRPDSPTLTYPQRSTSPTAPPPVDSSSSTTPPPSSILKRPPPHSDPLGSRDRHASKDSLASSTFTLSNGALKPNGLNGLADLGSPLMGQTMTFGPKSSYGSTASPLKSRSASSGAASSLVPPPRTHPGQFSNFRATPSPSGLHHRLSQLSTGSSNTDEDEGDEDSEYADRSFDSAASAAVAAREGRLLRQKDDAFLADLTEVFSVDGEGESGRRGSSAEE
jgi:hypothetical protein